MALRWASSLVLWSCLIVSDSPCSDALGERARGTPHPTTTTQAAPALRIAGQVLTGYQPKSVYVSRDGSRVYVCNFGRPDQENIVVYDAVTLRRQASIDYEGNCVELAFSPDGRTLYASNFRRGVVEVIDVSSRTVRGEIPVGRNPKSIEVSADGTTLYVANYFSRSVSVIDVASLTETSRLRTGVMPRGMALARNGRLFVAAFAEQVIHEFDTRAGNRQVRRIPTCRYPRDIVLSPDQRRLYVACSCCRAVQWHDVSTGNAVGSALVGHNPRTLDISSNGHWVAVGDFDSSTVSLIDTVSNRHSTTFVGGSDQISGIAIRPGSQLRIYATSWNNNRLYALVPRQGG